MVEYIAKDSTDSDDYFASAAAEFDDDITFTYCTEFIVGRDEEITTDPNELRLFLETIGDCVVDVKTLNGTLYLDSDTQNAYNNKGNQNLNINAPVFPVLGDGEIKVAFSGGIERVEIIPRWWEL